MNVNKRIYPAILLVLLVTVLISFNVLNRKKIDSSEIKPIRLNSFNEIVQDEDDFIAKPSKIIGYNDNIYVLERNNPRILVFSNNRFSHTIGKPGQGPGEISIDETDRRKLFYSFELTNGLILKRKLIFEENDLTIRDCCFSRDRVVVLDYNLNLFIGG